MIEEFEPAGVDYGEYSFRVRQHVLAKLAAHAAAAVPGSGTPLLTSFRVRVRQGGLSLAATDMERTVIAGTQAVYTEGIEANAYFETFVPAKRLQAILKESDEDVTVEVRGNKATVKAGPGSWSVSLPDGGDYPALVEPGQLSFVRTPCGTFLAALRAVRHAVCKDAGRPPLTQVAVGSAPDGGWCVTASDGTRFARAALPDFPLPLTVPLNVLDDLIRLLAGSQEDEVGTSFTDDAVVFEAGPVVLAVAKRTTPFPDMDRLLLAPALENDQVLRVDRDELAAAVRRVRINADTALALLLDGERLTVTGRDKFGNSASETVAAGWGGKDRVLCVNHAFLSEMLSAHPDKTAEFLLGRDVGKRRSSVLLRGGGITQLIAQMPPALVGY